MLHLFPAVWGRAAAAAATLHQGGPPLRVWRGELPSACLSDDLREQPACLLWTCSLPFQEGAFNFCLEPLYLLASLQDC